MKHKFNVIRIDGFKGLIIAAFVVCCLIAGFLSFPGWICMNIWNFTAGFFSQMPQMTLVHGMILWCIIALSAYALNKGNFNISFGSAAPMHDNDERIKEILRKINEERASIIKTGLENMAEDKKESDSNEKDNTNMNI